MYYRVMQSCIFDGVAYRAGDVIDLADPEDVSKMLREVGLLVEVTDSVVPTRPQPVPLRADEPDKAPAPVKAPALAPAKPRRRG